MLFRPVTVSLLALFGASNAAQLKRSDDLTLYAYGSGISGLEVYYGDGLAYLGDPAVIGDMSEVSNLSFSIPDGSIVATSTTGMWSNSSDPTLYINSDGFSQAGFLFPNETSNMTTTGFKMYGSNLGWEDSSGDLNMRFWAVPTNTTGIWNLFWNPDMKVYTTGTPVSLRSV